MRVERVDREVILALRERVLGGDGTRAAALFRDLSPNTRHWAALQGGVAVGCVSVMKVRGWTLRGMAVSEQVRRRGIGTLLWQAVRDEVDAPMWCNARLDSVPFYASVGWIELGPVFDLPDRGPHQRMTWSKG